MEHLAEDRVEIFDKYNNIFQQFYLKDFSKEQKNNVFVFDFDKTITFYHLYYILRKEDKVNMEMYKLDKKTFYEYIFGGAVRIQTLKYFFNKLSKNPHSNNKLIILSFGVKREIVEALKYSGLDKYFDEIYTVSQNKIDFIVNNLMKNEKLVKNSQNLEKNLKEHHNLLNLTNFVYIDDDLNNFKLNRFKVKQFESNIYKHSLSLSKFTNNFHRLIIYPLSDKSPNGITVDDIKQLLYLNYYLNN